jgi:hypothetical protein
MSPSLCLSCGRSLMVKGLSVSPESTTCALEPSGILILDFASVDFSTTILDEVSGKGRGVGRGRWQLLTTRASPMMPARAQSVRTHQVTALAVAMVTTVTGNAMAARTRTPPAAPIAVRSSRASSGNGPSATLTQAAAIERWREACGGGSTIDMRRFYACGVPPYELPLPHLAGSYGSCSSL